MCCKIWTNVQVSLLIAVPTFYLLYFKTNKNSQRYKMCLINLVVRLCRKILWSLIFPSSGPLLWTFTMAYFSFQFRCFHCWVDIVLVCKTTERHHTNNYRPSLLAWPSHSLLCGEHSVIPRSPNPIYSNPGDNVFRRHWNVRRYFCVFHVQKSSCTTDPSPLQAERCTFHVSNYWKFQISKKNKP